MSLCLRSILVVGLAVVGVFPALAVAQPATEQLNALLDRGIVRIRATEVTRNGITNQLSGTGFFVSAEGHILTNNHVVENGLTELRGAIGNSQSFSPLTVVARDEARDLAIVRFTNMPGAFASIRLTNSDGHLIGEEILAFGFAQEQRFRLIGRGLISSRTRTNWVVGIALAPGDSGSPVFSRDHDLIGIARSGRENGAAIADVIPINEAADLCRKVDCDSTPDYPGHRPDPPLTTPQKGPPLAGSFVVKMMGFSDIYPVFGLLPPPSTDPCTCEVTGRTGGLGLIAVVEQTVAKGIGGRLAVSSGLLPEIQGLEQGYTRYLNDTFVTASPTVALLRRRDAIWTAFGGIGWAVSLVDTFRYSSNETSFSSTQTTSWVHQIGAVVGTDLSVRLSARLRGSLLVELNLIPRESLPSVNSRVAVGFGLALR